MKAKRLMLFVCDAVTKKNAVAPCVINGFTQQEVCVSTLAGFRMTQRRQFDSMDSERCPNMHRTYIKKWATIGDLLVLEMLLFTCLCRDFS